jgi:protein-tyrosine phosphatase
MVEYEAPDIEELCQTSTDVASLIQQGEIVYVHCRVGIQRAPLVACAVLIQLGWSLADAYRVVSSRRAVAAISEEQLDVLRKLAAMVGRRLMDAPTPRPTLGGRPYDGVGGETQSRGPGQP